jgi:DNA-binding LytR/AlgR family response regulator
MKIATLIVDDEPLARSGMSDYVARVDFLEEAGQCRSGMEALSVLERQTVDLLLLDIQMPGLDGTELIRSLPQPPAVIFTTAHPSFAVEGFELDAIDYLLKPIGFPRFLRAVLKAKEHLGSSAAQPAPASAPSPPETDDIFIREDGRVTRLRTEDILYAEAMQNYSRIYTTDAHYVPLLPLRQLLSKLPEDRFVQIHRSYLVNLDRVKGVEGNQLRIGSKLLPVSRNNREHVLQRLLGDRLL